MKINRLLQNTTSHVALVALGGLFLVTQPVFAQEFGPHEWLNKMNSAVQTTNYQGTVIRTQNGNTEALKVVHLLSDGVIREKLMIQEGNGLEIIRNGNEVHCILPDKRSVLVEEWNDQSTLFSTLPTSDIRFGSEYDVLIVDEDRVAGRKAVKLAIRPHDQFRYGHEIWLDRTTGFPLQTILIDDSGEPIEQVKFADISLDQEIHASALLSSYSTDDFRWYSQPSKRASQSIETDWNSADLPAGFRVISTDEEQLPGKDELVTHILFSDGLASVSVFIELNEDADVARRARVGASHSFSVAIGDRRVTAVGEVPAATVEQIARSMQLD